MLPNKINAKSSEALEAKLLAADVTAQSLQEDWGIILWSIRAKEKAGHLQVKVKVQALRKLNEDALTQWFINVLELEPADDLLIRQKPLSECCFSPCEGCLMGNPEKRAFWIRLPAKPS